MKKPTLFVAATLLLQSVMLAGAQSPGMAALPANTNASTGAPTTLTAAVFDRYFAIQRALARDSLENVEANAWAIAQLVRQDRTGVFRPELAAVADSLAGATDLITARQVFKAVSGYVIVVYRAGRGPGGSIYELHCSAYNVNWLQRGDNVEDPYLGGIAPSSPN